MMKKLFALLTLCVAVLAASSALAGGPTGGLRPMRKPTPSEAISRSPYSVSTDKTTYSAGETIVFNVVFPEGGSYELSLCIDDHSYADANIADTMWSPARMSTATCEYSLAWTPGEYVVFVDFYDANGVKLDEEGFAYLTVVAAQGTNQLTDKVRQVVSQCKGSNDFQTLLNLYNWVKNNCVYDKSCEFYSAESMFFQGKGVCNSYSRALSLLLTEAGIPCRRVVGYTDGDEDNGHAWNAAQIGGQWYLYDPTWDDNVDNYYYCGLTDELMGKDHTPEKYVGGTVTCSSLESNYFIRTDRWEQQGWWVSEDRKLRSYGDQMAEAMLAGDASATISGQQYVYSSINHDGDHVISYGYGGIDTTDKILFAIYAYGLSRADITLWDSAVMDITATYNWDAHSFSYTAHGWKNAAAGTLMLPAATQAVEASAFEGVSAGAVVVPQGCATIGDNAFAGSGVRTVTFLGDTALQDSAFSGCRPLLIYAADGTPAAAWAEDHADEAVLRLRP